MKFKTLFWVLLLGVSGLFLACSDDNESENPDPDPDPEVVQVREFILFLNQGNMGDNDAGITWYDPDGDQDKVDDIYKAVNKKGLGDQAQDMVLNDSVIYVSVSDSKIVIQMDTTCKEIRRLSLTENYGKPRSLLLTGGKLYLSTYGVPGKILKLNPETLVIEDEVEVGGNPEGMAETGGRLFVANSQYEVERTVSVIDLTQFRVIRTIENLVTGPTYLRAVNGDIYMIPAFMNALQKIDGKTYQVDSITRASKMAVYGDMIYLANCETDFNDWSTTTTYSTYNTLTGELSTRSFLQTPPTVLETTYTSMLEVNPYNGDIYIGIMTDFVSNGDIYRFSADGKLVDEFESGGLNPTKALFFK